MKHLIMTLGMAIIACSGCSSSQTPNKPSSQVTNNDYSNYSTTQNNNSAGVVVAKHKLTESATY